MEGGNLKEAVKTINSILKEDKKSSTYKFALLRGTIETVEHYGHYGEELENGDITYPTGLLLEKWLYYYYPLVANGIPQLNGEDPKGSDHHLIAFRTEFEEITEYYEPLGGFGDFWVDYKRGQLPETLTQPFLELLKKIRGTVREMPMKHLGVSYYGEHYQLLEEFESPIRFTKNNIPDRIIRQFVVSSFGRFRIQRNFHDLIKIAGPILLGTDSILFHWASFTSEANKKKYNISMSEALEYLSHVPDEKRDVQKARKVYEQAIRESSLPCVWTGTKLTERILNVDHAIPFSEWRNNDLWNLLPSTGRANSKKKQKIPHPDLIKKRSSDILRAWNVLHDSFHDSFQKEIRIGLIGEEQFVDDKEKMMHSGIDRLAEKCETLISDRGLPAWKGEGLPDHVTTVKKGKPQIQETAEDEKSPRKVPFDQLSESDLWSNHLPVTGAIAAGDLAQGFFSENIEHLREFDWVEVPEMWAGNRRFVVEVTGESMEPTLSKGDLVIFEYHRNLREEGTVVIANFREFADAEISNAIKRIEKGEDGWILKSDNEEYEDLYMDQSEVPEFPILGIAKYNLTRDEPVR